MGQPMGQKEVHGRLDHAGAAAEIDLVIGPGTMVGNGGQESSRPAEAGGSGVGAADLQMQLGPVAG